MALPVQFFCVTYKEHRLHVWRDRAWHCVCGRPLEAQSPKFRPVEISSSDHRSRGGRNTKLHSKRGHIPHQWVLSTDG